MSTGEDDAALQGDLDRLCARFSGRVGYAIHDLSSGRRLLRDADVELPTASTVKLPILTALHEHARRTGLDWDAPVPVSTSGVAAGSGILQHLSRTLEMSYRDLAWLMICLSDNTATNLVVDAMGREHAAALIRELIDPAIRLRGLAGAGFDTERPSMGYATPDAMGRYLDRLARGDLPGAAETLTVARQQVFSSMIPRYLPLSPSAEVPLTIAHKTGALPGVRNDVAIIRAGEATVTMAIFTADCADLGYDTIHEGELTIGAIAYAVCRSWLGVSSPAGEAQHSPR